jgi:OmpA-OmpF porin, OOP family
MNPKFSLTAGKCLGVCSVLVILCAAACTPKHVPTPSPATPPAKQDLVVLLPDPDGKPGGIEVKNSAGSQSLARPYQAVRVERSDLSPSPPFAMEEAEVRRLFGAAMDTLPVREVQFVLYFVEGSDSLIPESEAQLPAIFTAIEERRSTAVAVTGHTDMTGNSASNYQLGMKRAQRVANILISRGMDSSHVFVDSHGESDPVVKTPRGVAEQLNRRVEVIVR